MKKIIIMLAAALFAAVTGVRGQTDTSYLLIQGPFGSGGSMESFKFQIDYPAGDLITGQDLLNAVLGTPSASCTVSLSDPVFGGYNYDAAGNSSRGAGYVNFGGGSLLTYSLTLGSTPVTTNDSTPAGGSTLGWTYFVAGGSGLYGGAYSNTGNWIPAGDGANTRSLANDSYDGWVFGNSGDDIDYTQVGTAATIDDSSNSDKPSDFSNNGPNDVSTVINVVPEPGSTALVLAGAAGMFALLKRQRAL